MDKRQNNNNIRQNLSRSTLQLAGIELWKWDSKSGYQSSLRLSSFKTEDYLRLIYFITNYKNGTLKEPKIELSLQGENNQIKWVEMTITSIILDENQIMQLIEGVYTDITRLKNEVTIYKDLALKDTLTDLYNRIGLNQIINKYDFTTHEAALFFLDLDNFKKLNDIYGHDAGNEMLISIAHAIQEILPPHSHLARVSGDEFIIFVEYTNNYETLTELANSLLEAIVHANKQTVMDDATLTASIGIAMCPDHSTDPDKLIKKADIAMYIAKKHGKAKFVFYNESVNEDYYDYTKVHQTLIQAFKQNEFKVSYQPIYDLKNQQIEAFEVFPYWNHPKKGLIAYENFLQTLYQEGLIFTFDEWMIEEAIKRIADLKAKGITIKMTINISPKHLALEHLHKYVARKLNQYQVDGHSLYIEMVEFILKEDFEIINNNFKRLQELGCKIIIDGFGINHSTFSVIKIMNFDIIKINKYFIETLNEEYSSEIIFNTILRLANEHNKVFIADGVINKEQFEKLKNSQCKYLQGPYLSDPKPIEEIINMINRATKV